MTSPTLGSDDLTLDQSASSVQILPEPALVSCHVFFMKLRCTASFWEKVDSKFQTPLTFVLNTRDFMVFFQPFACLLSLKKPPFF